MLQEARELCETTTSRLSLEVRLLKADVIETLLYGCVMWTINATHDDEKRTSLSSGESLASSRAYHTNLSCAKPLKKTTRESI